jgi:hypothetical protein
MGGFKFLALAAVAAVFLLASGPKAQAQGAAGVAPDCPYGSYDYAPYHCAPDGDYGPEWFDGSVGPWFHGRSDFQGKVATPSVPGTATKRAVKMLAKRPRRGAKPPASSGEMKPGTDAATAEPKH